ncbi:VCBS repeat-containing protein [Streptomyces sp. NPDC001054]
MAAVALAGASLPATAASAAAPGSSADVPESAVERALTRAAESGKQTEVIAERGEFTTLYANPSGTLTQETSIVPLRVRDHGRLVDADPSLVLGKDNMVRPRAASVGMEFSGGGDRDMATIRRDGRSMSLAWDGPELPAPTLEGDTATYHEVFPGVDLRLRASVTGFQQLLVVKSREAAADPRVQRLDFPVRTAGVEVRTDKAGNLTAVNTAGQEVFTAPTPSMWDSSGVPAGQEPEHGHDSVSDALEAKPEPSGRSASGASAKASGAFVPGAENDGFTAAVGAAEQSVPASVRNDTLTLTPHKDLLDSPDTVFPVYIDPYVSGARNNWTAVAKAYPNTAYWNKSDNVARVGYESDTGGTWRSLFTLDTRNLSGKNVVKSTFRIKNTHAWSCTKKPVELWATNPISSATTWNKQPTWATKLGTVTDAKGWSGSCPAGNLEFDVKANAVKAAAGKWATMTLGLRASESDTYGWKKFDAKTAVLSTEYNSPPAVPSGLDTVPSTKNQAGCGNTAPYGLIGDTDIQLTAKGSDPDGGAVQVKFHLWATGHHPNDDPKGVLIVNQTVTVTSGTVAKLTVAKSRLTPYLAAAKGNFSWKAQASDGSLTSDWNPTTGAPGCRFVFDPERPSTPPSVVSAQFPSGDSGWPTQTGTVRTKGAFVVGPGGAGDIDSYEYWSTVDPAVRKASPAAVNGSVTVELTPTKAGPHHLYVRSLDKAGNRSDTRAYLFYANGSQVDDKDGDLNGDGHPDLWAVDGSGTLRRYFGDGTGNAIGASAPASASGYLTDTLVTRRGDWTDDGYEDLITLARDPATGRDRLWVRPNDGAGGLDIGDSRELRAWESVNDHWQGADQILAVGDVDGPLDIDGDGAIGPDDRPGYPDLLVKKGDELWLCFGSASGYLDEYIDQPPVLLGSGGWAGLDLAAPGKVSEGAGGTGIVARDRSGGQLYLYAPTGPSGEGLGTEAGRTQIGTGWTATARPLYTVVPDIRGDEKAGGWAVASTGELLTYPVMSGPGTAIATGFGAFTALT